ncbi:MAG: 30S ribosomal protein S2, partial [Muribaculaceae bacterium]|nr:30S ribosomal protein S2 [Muribaculaceae bacterium]
FVIPANDDASKSIDLILTTVCEAIAEGIEERKVERIDNKDEELQAEGEEQPRQRRARVRRRTNEDTPLQDEAPAAEAPAQDEAPAAEAPAQDEAPAAE